MHQLKIFAGSARVSAVVLGLVLLISASAWAQPASPNADTIRGFFKNLVGDWIGICEQSTDGQKADNKYFHVTIKQTDANTFNSSFEYYRLDEKTLAPLKIGTSTVTTTISPDGTANNKITGTGSVMVEKKPKDQQHELTEVLTCSVDGSLQGKGSGKISVNGLPLGTGKNGKVKQASSTWTFDNDTLKISQKLNVGFRLLLFSKSFDIAADFTAKRGTDVVGLMKRTHTYAKH